MPTTVTDWFRLTTIVALALAAGGTARVLHAWAVGDHPERGHATALVPLGTLLLVIGALGSVHDNLGQPWQWLESPSFFVGSLFLLVGMARSLRLNIRKYTQKGHHDEAHH